MATPTGNRADASRGFFARERRRKKQDQKDFDIAGFVAPGGTVFAFGVALPGGVSSNALTLPASVVIAIMANNNRAAGDVGILDETTGIIYFNAEPTQPGSVLNIRHLFREGRSIRIVHPNPGGSVIDLFFRGPKSSLTGFGQCFFA